MSLSRSAYPKVECKPNIGSDDNGLVLVVTSRRDDASQIEGILERAGYGCESRYSDPEHNDLVSFIDESDAHYVATVIRHHENDICEPSKTSAERMPGERVIVLSDSTDESTVVGLLESGAHYVIAADQSERLLQARLEAALRQHSCLASRSFVLGDLLFDVPKRRVFQKGESVDLSPKEFDLAYYLFSNRHRVVGNSELMTAIWSLPPSMDTRRIDTAACRLRKKLNLAVSSGWELKRLRGVGYQLVASAHPADVCRLDEITDEH